MQDHTFANAHKPQDQVHVPVLLNEMLTALEPKHGETYLDGTFGAGGYSRAILTSAECALYAIDRDPTAIQRASAISQEFDGRFTILLGQFGDMEALLRGSGVESLDGIVLDIGVSSPQIDTPERGFSFRFDGPLDMRMSAEGPTAADIVNEWPEEDLADLFYHYGEERRSRAVARAIAKARTECRIETTRHLADLVRSVVRKSKDGVDPATRTFQALRIEVNDELGELDRALLAAERLLKPGGRLVVVSFHSLEDRRVKSFLTTRSTMQSGGNRYLPGPIEASAPPSFRLPKRKPIQASAEEAAANPRARSARLRVALRTEAPIYIPTKSKGDAR